ncbi:MAG: hypothetical protein QOE77_3328 [Blastocatellia bacterium]|jgi:hypothetical protein|nr:hypothetical protein [Blastocatellia bacterium]
MSNTIFCDEAGITGNNLLDPEQRHFAFASVNVADARAKELVAQIIQDHRLQGSELKGSQLVKGAAGQRAIDALVASCLDHIHLSFYNKKYAIACELYSQTFGEIFGENNGIFFALDFNRFIANAIYLGLVTDNPLARAAVSDFQSLMRQKSGGVPDQIFSLSNAAFSANLFEAIILFCRLNNERIRSAVDPLLNDPSGSKWLLDLSYMAIFNHLTYWAQRHDSVDVYCDKSTPLEDQLTDLDEWIGRQEKIDVTVGTVQGRIGFNLLRRVQFADSHNCAGVQLADVFASALCYAVNHPSDQYSRSLLQRLAPVISEYSLVPDLEEIDIREVKPFVNSSILWQLVERSCRGEDLESFYEHIADFIIASRNRFHDYSATLTKEDLNVDFSKNILL